MPIKVNIFSILSQSLSQMTILWLVLCCLSLSVVFGANGTFTPTSQPTPDCDTIFVTIESWDNTTYNDTRIATFEGTFQKTDDIQFGKPIWRDYRTNGPELAFLSRWYIVNYLEDSITYDENSASFPPIGTFAWIHGTQEDLVVTLDCSSTGVPSPDPTLMPSYGPTSVPSNNPSYNPTSIPSNDPTGVPSSEPTSLPTFSPTVECSVILLSINESTIEYYNASEPINRRRLLNHFNHNNNNDNNNDFLNNNGPSARGLLDINETEMFIEALGDWVLVIDRTELNNRPTFSYSDDEYNVQLSYTSDVWTLQVDDLVNSMDDTWRDTSDLDGKLPPLASTWERDYVTTINEKTTTLQSAVIEIDCLNTRFPSGIPSMTPSSNPSKLPTEGPTGAPTEPTNAPSIAPTEACDEITLVAIDSNFLMNITGVIDIEINGIYVKQNNLISNRPWFEYDSEEEEELNAWIEYNNGAWFVLNPTETEDETISALFYESNAYEPPIDGTNSADDSDGTWWNTGVKLDDGSDNYKEYKISITCRAYTNEPTKMITTTEDIVVAPMTTMMETTIATTEEDEQTTEEDRYFGMTLAEWFVIIFIIFLILICVIGICWYREYKKAEIVEKEKKTKLTAYKGDDEDEIFGANRRSQAPNSPEQAPNRPGGGLELGGTRKSGAKYVSEGDDEHNTSNKPADQDAAFQNALAAATKSKSQY